MVTFLSSAAAQNGQECVVVTAVVVVLLPVLSTSTLIREGYQIDRNVDRQKGKDSGKMEGERKHGKVDRAVHCSSPQDSMGDTRLFICRTFSKGGSSENTGTQ